MKAVEQLIFLMTLMHAINSLSRMLTRESLLTQTGLFIL